MSQKQVLQGIGVGSRAVRAEVFRLTARQALPAPLKSASTPAEEAQTLSQAISSLEETYAKKIASASGNLKEILEAQSALATDSELFESAVQHCEGGWNASTAIQMAMNEFRELLSGADGEFGERVADLDEIVYRLVQILHREDSSRPRRPFSATEYCPGCESSRPRNSATSVRRIST